ncbi:MAG: nucleotidyltransferase domain-containing protein [Methylobacter sp.]
MSCFKIYAYSDTRLCQSLYKVILYIILLKLLPDYSTQLKTMRLTDEQVQIIRQLALQVAGNQARVRVFGSRLDNTAHGGDLDLMLELAEPVDNPALMVAQMSAQVSRAMHGRKVDVLLSAPNLMRLPIHDIAFKEGQLL